jgi:hypothetical protein
MELVYRIANLFNRHRGNYTYEPPKVQVENANLNGGNMSPRPSWYDDIDGAGSIFLATTAICAFTFLPSPFSEFAGKLENF